MAGKSRCSDERRAGSRKRKDRPPASQLRVCNAARDGVDQVRCWERLADIAASVLRGTGEIHEGLWPRARVPVPLRSRRPGRAARQLQAIGDGLAAPRAHEIGLAAPAAPLAPAADWSSSAAESISDAAGSSCGGADEDAKRSNAVAATPAISLARARDPSEWRERRGRRGRSPMEELVPQRRRGGGRGRRSGRRMASAAAPAPPPPPGPGAGTGATTGVSFLPRPPGPSLSLPADAFASPLSSGSILPPSLPSLLEEYSGMHSVKVKGKFAFASSI